MNLTKRDDQTLSTIGRVASYKPSVARDFVKTLDFDSIELKYSVMRFWQERLADVDLTSKQAFIAKLKNITCEDPNEHLIVHWLGAYYDINWLKSQQNIESSRVADCV
ncbi:hypothetical protein [Neptunicella sp. SCSIO 80796]|uniref:hypothetical protein n=1 Tax=Neptunicella plasticusilytica TaxID=3117012 RepID=UPI003A4E13A5